MSKYKNYLKRDLVQIRSYVSGEDTTDWEIINSVKPTLGGKVIKLSNGKFQYISEEYFKIMYSLDGKEIDYHYHIINVRSKTSVAEFYVKGPMNKKHTEFNFRFNIFKYADFEILNTEYMITNISYLGYRPESSVITLARPNFKLIDHPYCGIPNYIHQQNYT